MKIILETQRLLLREMTQSDFDALCKLLQDKDVMYAYEHPFSDEEVQAWLFNQLRRYKEDGFGLWAVILKETNEMIGDCGLTIQEYNHNNVVEVGYHLQKKYWHKGYATEAAVACKNHAFYSLDLKEVYSIIRDNNFTSQNVAKRNGMIKCDEFVKHYYGIDMPHWVYKANR